MNRPTRIDTETNSAPYTCGYCSGDTGGCDCAGYNRAIDEYEEKE